MILHESFDEENCVNDLERECMTKCGIGCPKDAPHGSKVRRWLK